MCADKLSDIRSIQKCLKNNILHEKQFIGHDKERQQVFDLLQRTIEHGESNSVLLIGPRASGKTTLINDVLKELRDTKNYFESDAVLVKLHGLIHTDDRLALKSATSQMGLDNAVDGKVFGSFADNLSFLLACLKSGRQNTAKSVIFILEEFDLFCAHHNQTLLYNLFDISQSAQTPLCVLGITCRLDVIELLEKRVKSRFSHRQIFLFIGEDDDDTNKLASVIDRKLDRIEQLLTIPNDAFLDISSLCRKQWNTNVKKLIKEKKFKMIMQRLIDIDLGERSLKNILIVVVSQLSEKHPKLTVDAFAHQLQTQIEKDDIVRIVQDLNVLELCLIIAMKHHNEIYDNQPMNFEMIYTRYMKFANANSNVQTVERPVVMKAFEHIQNLELISMVSARNNKVQKEYQLFKLLVFPHQITDAVGKSSNLPTEVVQWANSSFV